MKILILYTSIIILIISCKPSSDIPQNLNLIQAVENGLLPHIAIDGQKSKKWNIHERQIHYNVPGVSIAFFNNDKIEWTKQYGFRSSELENEVNHKTLFQAASISKPVAALGVLLLVQNNKISLDEPVKNYLSTWKLPENEFNKLKKVTLRQLLTHSAGLTVHGFGGYSHDEKLPDTNDILNGVLPANSGKVVLDTFPGARWKYSGGGYTIVQKIIEDISKMPFEKYMDSEIFSPIGMKNSTYSQPLPSILQDNAAWAHLGGGNTIEGKWNSYPEKAAAGLWTTPTDLAKFAMAIQRAINGSKNEILSPEMAEAMISPHLGMWGLGFSLLDENDSMRFAHGGSNHGYKCRLEAFLKSGKGIVIMTNGDNGRNLYSEILRSVSEAYEWDTHKPLIKSIINLTSAEMIKIEGKSQHENVERLILDIKINDQKLQVYQI